MKKTKFYTFIMALIISSRAFAVDGNAKNIFSKEQSDSLKKYLWKFPANTQLSVAIVKNGEAAYAGIILDKDSFHIVENRDSVFEVGSFTKVFTSEILSSFVNIGLVKTTDTIEDFFDFKLKDCKRNGKEITLEMLANHTSGLPRLDVSSFNDKSFDPNNPYKNYDEKALIDYLQNKMKLDTVPGTKFSYSNLGAGLLGYILCQKEHKTYETLLQENIFMPLGMKSTTTIRGYVQHRLVEGRNAQGEHTENWDFTDALAGAGAVKSCAADMVKFMLANFIPNKVFDLPRIKTFTIKEGMGIGLGWIIKSSAGKDDIYWHDGGTGGYRTCLAMDVKKKNGVVILSNVSSFHALNGNIDKLCFALLSSISK